MYNEKQIRKLITDDVNNIKSKSELLKIHNIINQKTWKLQLEKLVKSKGYPIDSNTFKFLIDIFINLNSYPVEIVEMINKIYDGRAFDFKKFRKDASKGIVDIYDYIKIDIDRESVRRIFFHMPDMTNLMGKSEFFFNLFLPKSERTMGNGDIIYKNVIYEMKGVRSQLKTLKSHHSVIQKIPQIKDRFKNLVSSKAEVQNLNITGIRYYNNHIRNGDIKIYDFIEFLKYFLSNYCVYKEISDFEWVENCFTANQLDIEKFKKEHAVFDYNYLIELKAFDKLIFFNNEMNVVLINSVDDIKRHLDDFDFQLPYNMKSTKDCTIKWNLK